MVGLAVDPINLTSIIDTLAIIVVVLCTCKNFLSPVNWNYFAL